MSSAPVRYFVSSVDPPLSETLRVPREERVPLPKDEGGSL